jgi:flagellar basal-body rod protein FlgF
METPLYVLLSQQDALERQMTVVSQNVANMNTTGFKSRDVLFQDFMTRPQGAKNENHFVLDRATLRNTAQGPIIRTDSPLDVAISGQGYFAVATPQGTQYTRQGSFQMDNAGNLVTLDGYRVLSADGQGITIQDNAKQVSIGADGTISTDVGDAGKLTPVKFDDEQSMVETYNGYYTSPDTPQPDPDSTITQGVVEASNVKPVVEMTRIIEISRAYQRVLNLIGSENDRMRNAIRALGQPT